jgi:hypothetical protein
VLVEPSHFGIPAAAEEMEAAFDERVQYLATVDSEYYRAQRIITTLEKENAARTAWAQKLAIDLNDKEAIIQRLVRQAATKTSA